jgi:hypothetical protein
MSLLIDGYNLLHVTGIVGRGIGPGSLQRSRLALVNFVAESLDPEDLPRTTIIFDAHNAPAGLPHVIQHAGISVRFAAGYETADKLIEELIRVDSAPRRLVVVSSDHEIQRAARRRRAKAIDSDVWYAELVRARRERNEASGATLARPHVPLLEEDVNYWLRQFGGESLLAELVARESKSNRPAPERSERRDAERSMSDKPPDDSGPIDNPFPPGYGEDLLSEL